MIFLGGHKINLDSLSKIKFSSLIKQGVDSKNVYISNLFNSDSITLLFQNFQTKISQKWTKIEIIPLF